MSKLPLYREVKDDAGLLALRRPEGSHAGLWYDKFFNQFNGDWKVIDQKEDPNKLGGKVNWMDSVAGFVGDKDMLTAHAVRTRALVRKLDGETMDFTADWNFVTGLGISHPVENGFAWHRTLGVPYLTGAAVKGMLRAFVDVWSGLEGDEKKARLDTWFGDKDSAGGLIFFDAVPVKPVRLIRDVMTCHMGGWYENGGNTPDREGGTNIPADWHDPNPVPFLVVAPGQTFQFAFARRPGMVAKSTEEIKLTDVADALKDALEFIGAGAKTAAGYGRFTETPDSIAEREQREAEALRDPLAEFSEWFGNQKFGAANKGEHGKLISRLKELPDVEAGKQFVKEHLRKGDCAPKLWEFLKG